MPDSAHTADMPPSAGLATGTRAALTLPRPSLASCVRAYMMRSTLDAPVLSEAQRRNHFPASTYCTVTWYLQGRAILLRQGDTETELVLPCPIGFSGPRPEPVVTCNPGKVEFFMMVLLPEALHAMTGIDISTHANRSSPFEQVFCAEWQAMARAVLAAPDHAQRIALIEQFLEPRWKAARNRDSMLANWLRDYANGMALRIVTSPRARSLRQLERYVKTISGLSLQRLGGMRRSEQRFFAARDAVSSGDAWADIASDTGYADQAHLCRETRKMTGLSPKELTHRVLHEESYWVHRIWS